MNKILLFSHYNKHNRLLDYVIYWLEHLKPIFAKIIFISNSHLADEHKHVLNKYCDNIIERSNIGYDFGAWKDAMLAEGWDALIGYDSVTLMNDTCFGPMFDMQEFYAEMESRQCDFWGNTRHRALYRDGRGKKQVAISIPEHLQSYFLVFNKNVVSSETFQEFWSDVTYENDVCKVIDKYEIQLTQILAKTGFQYDSFIDSKKFQNDYVHRDLIREYPFVMLYNKSPFLKAKSILIFSYPKYILQYINNKLSYPTILIDRHITSIVDPAQSIKLLNKIVPLQQNFCVKTNDDNQQLSVALHLHVYYMDVFLDKFLPVLINLPIDIFITTNDEAKKQEIEQICSSVGLYDKVKKIYITPNRGRDILPWLLIQKDLNQYDVVGHFHTKKSILVDEWIGDSWCDEIISSLFMNYDNIMQQFKCEQNLGIVISDMPYFFALRYDDNLWIFTKNEVQDFLSKMNVPCDFICNEKNSMIASFGTMFWYRPLALKPLFDLHLTENDFPQEPIGTQQTLAHMIERLPVYIAWSLGYDFKIVIAEETQSSSFENYNTIVELHDQYREKIKYYKKINILFLLYRAIRSIFKKCKNMLNFVLKLIES